MGSEGEAIIFGALPADKQEVSGTPHLVEKWKPEELVSRLDESEVAIFTFGGGWGLEPLSKDKDFGENLDRIMTHLEKSGCRVGLIDDARKETVRQILSMRQSASTKHAARVINSVMEKREDLQVLLIGLSNGANFLEKVRAGIEETYQDRLWALEFGRPTWPWVRAQLENRLGTTREIYGPGDFLRNWDLTTLRKTLKTMSFPPKIELLHGRPRARFDVPGHVYDWDAIGEETKDFLEEIIRKVKEAQQS